MYEEQFRNAIKLSEINKKNRQSANSAFVACKEANFHGVKTEIPDGAKSELPQYISGEIFLQETPKLNCRHSTTLSSALKAERDSTFLCMEQKMLNTPYNKNVLSNSYSPDISRENLSGKFPAQKTDS